MSQFDKSLYHNLSRVSRDRHSRNIGCIGEPFLTIEGKPAYGQQATNTSGNLMAHLRAFYVLYGSLLVYTDSTIHPKQVAIGET